MFRNHALLPRQINEDHCIVLTVHIRLLSMVHSINQEPCSCIQTYLVVSVTSMINDVTSSRVCWSVCEPCCLSVQSLTPSPFLCSHYDEARERALDMLRKHIQHLQWLLTTPCTLGLAVPLSPFILQHLSYIVRTHHSMRAFVIILNKFIALEVQIECACVSFCVLPTFCVTDVSTL